MDNVENAAAEAPEVTSRWRAALARLPLHPFEWICLLFTCWSIGFLRHKGMRIDWKTVEYTVYPMLQALPMPLLVGLGLQLAVRALLRKPLGDYFRALASWRWWVLWLRLWIVCMALTYSYYWVKVCVPLLRRDLLDPQLWNLDRLLHLGISPSIFATSLFEGGSLAPAIDAWYGLFISSVLVMLSYFTAGIDDLERRRFMLSCVFLWGVGSWLYVLLPALGPIYFVPELWKELSARMPAATAMQAALWQNYQTILAGRESGILREFKPIYAIAAMPSLHVAGHALFAFWTWRAARPVGWFFVVATGLTFLGSLVTGWHYAVDGYAGLLLAYGSYRLALFFEREPAVAPERPGSAD